MKIGIDIGNSFITASTLNHKGEPILIKDYNSKNDWEVFTPMKLWVNDRFSFVGKVVETLFTSDKEFSYIKDFFLSMGEPDSMFHDADNQKWKPEELLAIVLRKLKIDIEGFNSRPISDIAVSFPAFFGEEGKAKLKNAFLLAGFLEPDFLPDFQAAILGSGLDYYGSSKKIVVFDLGKTHFNFSLVTSINGTIKPDYISPKYNFGALDVEIEISKIIKKQVEERFGENIVFYPEDELRISKLSELIKAEFASPFSSHTNDLLTIGKETIKIIISESQFHNVLAPIINTTIKEISKAQNNIDFGTPDHLLLVGGSGKINLLQRILSAHFGESCTILAKAPRKISAKGAAIFAYSNNEELQIVFAEKKVESLEKSISAQTINQSQELFKSGESLPASNTFRFKISPESYHELEIKILKSNEEGDLNEVFGIINIKLPPELSSEEIDLKVSIDSQGDFYFTPFLSDTKDILKFSFIKNDYETKENEVQEKKTIRIIPRVQKPSPEILIEPLKIKPKLTPKISISKKAIAIGKTLEKGTLVAGQETSLKKKTNAERIKEMVINNII